MRVTCSVQRKQRKKKILDIAKGFYGRKKSCYGLAIDTVRRKHAYEYRDRRCRKRQMRGLWIQRLSAAANIIGLSYSKMMHQLNQAGCIFNRKILSEMAARNFDDFVSLIGKFISFEIKTDIYNLLA